MLLRSLLDEATAARLMRALGPSAPGLWLREAAEAGAERQPRLAAPESFGAVGGGRMPLTPGGALASGAPAQGLPFLRALVEASANDPSAGWGLLASDPALALELEARLRAWARGELDTWRAALTRTQDPDRAPPPALHVLEVDRPGAPASLAQAGALLLRSQALPVHAAWWEAVEQGVEALPRARQDQGDIADHQIDVAMVVSNRPRPTVQGPQAQALLDVLLTPLLGLLTRAWGGEGALHLRRAQVNWMRAGDHNHFHRDTWDDPDYVLAAVLYLDDPEGFEGGALLLEGATEELRPPRRSMVVFPGELGHALTPVRACARPRRSVVLLFGAHDGPNRRFAGG